MDFIISFIDGHDMRFKSVFVDAETEDDARSKLYELYGNFDHNISEIREADVRYCPVCEKKVDRSDMYYTKDCHGITFRLLCYDCYKKAMAKGYDGEYYTEEDECIDEY